MCVREPGSTRWAAPAGLTFRDWLRGAASARPDRRRPGYHLSTLFPPVRPRGHLELRVIDAQPGDGWIVPTAVVSGAARRPAAAAQAAMAADGAGCCAARPAMSLLAARRPARPGRPAAGRGRPECFAAADEALARGSAHQPRCGTRWPRSPTATCCAAGAPADDLLDEARGAESPAHLIRYLHDIRLPDDTMPINQEDHR